MRWARTSDKKEKEVMAGTSPGRRIHALKPMPARHAASPRGEP
jgi:hypothetical protein